MMMLYWLKFVLLSILPYSYLDRFFIVITVDRTLIGGTTRASVKVHIAALRRENMKYVKV